MNGFCHCVFYIDQAKFMSNIRINVSVMFCIWILAEMLKEALTVFYLFILKQLAWVNCGDL